MRSIFIPTLICLTFLTALHGVEEGATKPVTHSFLAADYGGNKVYIVNAEGNITWQYPAVCPQDIWLLKNGNILLSHLLGVKEVTREKSTVWEYTVEEPNEVHSCQPLKNGNYMVAVAGPCQIREIDHTGKIVKTVNLKTVTKDPHLQMRIARKLSNDNYLVGHFGDKAVREYDWNGKMIREIKTDGNVYAGYRLPNGNTLISLGDAHKIIEVDDTDKIVWQVNENDLEGNPLRFAAGMQRLENGNTVVANWGGHGHVGQQPQLFEVTPDKKVVWQVLDNKLGTISNMNILGRTDSD
ncbi:MAG: hypothetical protein A2Y07_04380 [Planctomycetes bacterium GWF2_50_10]|nr:MAG: hypothetical protein A2Y07_04380 [Planctomycetes bacterium GWF2_50_10]